MTFRLENLLLAIAVGIYILIGMFGGCTIAWVMFGWFSGAAMASWAWTKLSHTAGRLIA